MDQNPSPSIINGVEACNASTSSSFDEKEKCLRLCSDILTELMKNLTEVTSTAVWIHKEKFSINFLVLMELLAVRNLVRK